jgi:hypothetical protein
MLEGVPMSRASRFVSVVALLHCALPFAGLPSAADQAALVRRDLAKRSLADIGADRLSRELTAAVMRQAGALEADSDRNRVILTQENGP